jgi:hypothetical protein
LKVAEAKNRVLELQMSDIQSQYEQLKAKNREFEEHIKQLKASQMQPSITLQGEHDVSTLLHSLDQTKTLLTF